MLIQSLAALRYVAQVGFVYINPGVAGPWAELSAADATSSLVGPSGSVYLARPS